MNTTTTTLEKTYVTKCHIDSITMWGNARKHFSQSDLEELAASLLDSGEAHHPPVGFLEDPDDGTTVKLFMGERRLRAHRMLRDRGHEQFGMMAVSIRPKPTEAQLHKWSLAENLQRVDLRPSETGEELSRMLGMEDEMSGQSLWTMRSLAEEIGKPVSWVSLAMMLVKAPDSVRSAVDEGDCAMEVGALVGILPAALREGAAAEMVHGPMGPMKRDQARVWVGERYRRDLRKAEFSTEESGLAGKPACVRCEWWGGNRSDVEGRNASTACLNPACFLEKQREAVVLRASERGAQLTLWDEVTDGPGIWEAHSGRLSPDAGYVELGERPSPQMLDSEVADGMVMPTWGEVLRDSGITAKVAFDPMGQPRELVRTGEALRGASTSRWGSLFRDGAVAAYLSPEERAAERAVRAAGDREGAEVLLEGLSEFCRGLSGGPSFSGDLLIGEATRYVMESLLKSEDVAVLATVLGAPGKSVAAIEEVVATHEGPKMEVALVLALLVRRMRYEGFSILVDDEDSPLMRLAELAKFDAGAWHRKQKKRREVAQMTTREEEEARMERAAGKAIAEGRARRGA
jgi:ParB/RepB/Spo0J family partition protein